MPVIPEEKQSDMDQFVNWDHADPALGTNLGTPSLDFMYTQQPSDPLQDLDLVLENVEGDDFSFWALEHYENSNLPTLDPTNINNAITTDMGTTSIRAFEESFGTPDAPCTHCQSGGYQCKTIREGKYKGYCTSCVALRCACSFGLAPAPQVPTDSAFPHNPWPLMGDHPDAITQEDGHLEKLHASVSAPDLAGLRSLSGAESTGVRVNATAAPKIGARFSRESVKILKNWLSTHHKHPYPNEDEKEMLQKQTGLNKTQITNWLANARRRGKIIAPRSTSPGVRSWSNAIDIPQRRATPASFENMNPLQRWQHSPPENEPASVTDIARAVTDSASTMSSGLNSPYSMSINDDGSNRSLCAVSSISSINTSHSSGGSFASAYSHKSRGSFGSHGSMSINRGRRRRRRKVATKGPEERTSLTAPLKTFQCTFCTETFRTKHDWQRHEKSLHLSLERWVCAPEGPRVFNPTNGAISCVFCGEANPDEAHVESHNHLACQERTLEERTFYRKDHLRQHLKLVHEAKFVDWSMEQWKVATPEIRSRCGFCGIVMDTWTIRVDHLAEHFKTGNTMADWKGDWGFEAPVLDMLENSIPPYLIHDERNSPYPFEATQGSPETPRNAYELIKAELSFYISNERERRRDKMPTDEELQIEACRIVFGSEVLSKKGISSAPSWLRDLLLSSNEQLTLKAQMAPIRSHADSFLAKLVINGKDNIFEDDSMELELREYVKARRLLGLTAMDRELQVEACSIIGRMEESSRVPSDDVANFLLRVIYSSGKWLAGFRQRAGLPRSEDLEDESKRSKDPNTIDSTIHNYSRLESELAEYVRLQRSAGIEPTDADLQRQARLIIYEFDDGWNQTAADNVAWLNAFKQRHSSLEASAAALASNAPLTINSVMSCPDVHPNMASVMGCPDAQRRQATTARDSPGSDTFNSINGSYTSGSGNGSFGRNGSGSGSGSGNGAGSASASGSESAVKVGAVFLNDANCYRRLARELGRYVASTMSPNNPRCHVPSDEELQHQARWILYDDDDPWNQTAADNVEWLRRFKRDVGILTDGASFPGLPQGIQWNISQGGSGFAPPYVFPNPKTQITLPSASSSSPSDNAASLVAVTNMADGASSRAFPVESATTNKYLQSFRTEPARMQPPPVVFCSRELEARLAAYVVGEVVLLGGGGGGGGGAAKFPSDNDLRARAREIQQMPSTPADDPVLLGKFKEMMRERLGLGLEVEVEMEGVSRSGSGSGSAGLGLLTGADGNNHHQGGGLNMDLEMALAGSGGGADDGFALQDMDFDFDFDFGVDGLAGSSS